MEKSTNLSIRKILFAKTEEIVPDSTLVEKQHIRTNQYKKPWYRDFNKGFCTMVFYIIINDFSWWPKSYLIESEISIFFIVE